MFFYFLIFLVITLFIIFNNKKLNYSYFVFCGILLFLVTAFRNSAVDKDYDGYIKYFNLVLKHNWFRVEPTFIIIAKIVNQFTGSSFYLFVVYALLGVFLKFYAINKLTDLQLFSVLIYFSGYFLLHEMTQIRAGVASGLLLLCIPLIHQKKLGEFLVLATLAFFFHYSAIIIFPLYFLNGNKLNIYIYSLLIPISYIIYFSHINVLFFVKYIPIRLIQLKIGSYSYYASIDKQINVFNYLHLSRCLLAYLLLWKWKLIVEDHTYTVILLKIYIISLFAYVAFANIPAISSRTSELMMVVEIILIPYLYSIIKQKYLASLVIIGIGLAFLSLNLFYVKLLNGYFT